MHGDFVILIETVMMTAGNPNFWKQHTLIPKLAARCLCCTVIVIVMMTAGNPNLCGHTLIPKLPLAARCLFCTVIVTVMLTAGNPNFCGHTYPHTQKGR